MSESRREAFSVEHGRDNNHPGYADKWIGIRSGETTPFGTPRYGSASVARLTGGYITSENPNYKAFPKGDPSLLDFIGEGGTGQGELFNWEHPQIKGLYRGDNSSKMDLGSALGMAVNESKRRWGVEPIEDEQLSAESAELTKKLTGRDNPVTYHKGYSKSDARSYGNMMANIVDTRAKDSSSSEILPASDIEEGSKTIRTRVSELRKAKNQSSKNTMPNESRVSAFKQTIIPGMENIG